MHMAPSSWWSPNKLPSPRARLFLKSANNSFISSPASSLLNNKDNNTLVGKLNNIQSRNTNFTFKRPDTQAKITL